MAKGRRREQSYVAIRAYMNEITARHTGRILRENARKRWAGSKASVPDPGKIAVRQEILKGKGLLEALTNSGRVTVQLPGNFTGIAIGLTPECFVIVEGWNDPFSPRSVRIDDEQPET